MSTGYGEKSRASSLIEARSDEIVVSKRVWWEEIAEWPASAGTFRSTLNTDRSTYYTDTSLVLEWPKPEDKDATITRKRH